MAQYAQYGAPMHGGMSSSSDTGVSSSGMLGPPGRGDPNSTCFVGNISYDVPIPHIEALLREAGNIQALRMKHDPTPGRHHKGWGFCTYDTPMEAQRALQTLNDRILGGRNVRVKPQTGASGGGGGMSSSMPPSLPMGGAHGGYGSHAPMHQHQHAHQQAPPQRAYGATAQVPMGGGFALQPLGGGAALGSARPSYARAAPTSSSSVGLAPASLASSDRPMLAAASSSGGGARRAPAILGGQLLGPGEQDTPRLDGQSVAQRLGAYELWCSLGEAREVARRDPASMRSLLKGHPELGRALLLGLSRLGLLRKETAVARAEARKRGDLERDASILVEGEGAGAGSGSSAGGQTYGQMHGQGQGQGGGSLLGSIPSGQQVGPGPGPPTVASAMPGPSGNSGGLLGAPPPVATSHPTGSGALPMGGGTYGGPPPGGHYSGPGGHPMVGGVSQTYGGYGAGAGAPQGHGHGHGHGMGVPQGGAGQAPMDSGGSGSGAAHSGSGSADGSSGEMDEEIILMMDIMRMSDEEVQGIPEAQREGVVQMRSALMTPGSEIDGMAEPQKSEMKAAKAALFEALEGAGVSLDTVPGLRR